MSFIRERQGDERGMMAFEIFCSDNFQALETVMVSGDINFRSVGQFISGFNRKFF
jgi:hypothetical protein